MPILHPHIVHVVSKHFAKCAVRFSKVILSDKSDVTILKIWLLCKPHQLIVNMRNFMPC